MSTLIEKLRNKHKEWASNPHYWMDSYLIRDVFNDVIGIVKQHDEWVAVSERLPSESGNYLVYRYNGKTNNWEVTIEYFCTQSEWFKPYRSINNITHWRRLPQPPRGVQNV